MKGSKTVTAPNLCDFVRVLPTHPYWGDYTIWLPEKDVDNTTYFEYWMSPESNIDWNDAEWTLVVDGKLRQTPLLNKPSKQHSISI